VSKPGDEFHWVRAVKEGIELNTLIITMIFFSLFQRSNLACQEPCDEDEILQDSCSLVTMKLLLIKLLTRLAAKKYLNTMKPKNNIM